MNMFERFSSVLKIPAGYRFFRWMVGGEYALKTYLADYVKPVPGEKIFDIGCGPADVLDYLPEANYTGLDISPEYTRSATRRFGSRGRFLCGDVGQASIEEEQGSFDLVLATGLLHHLDDSQADRLFDLARRAMRPTGRLITFDGCYVPEQAPVARWLLTRDRGKFVRREEDYLKLASTQFVKVESCLRHDLLRIPYTHLIMRCHNQVPTGR